eukprot:ANDGO_07495.mRNA.1 hypothetical protein
MLPYAQQRQPGSENDARVPETYSDARLEELRILSEGSSSSKPAVPLLPASHFPELSNATQSSALRSGVGESIRSGLSREVVEVEPMDDEDDGDVPMRSADVEVARATSRNPTIHIQSQIAEYITNWDAHAVAISAAIASFSLSHVVAAAQQKIDALKESLHSVDVLEQESIRGIMKDSQRASGRELDCALLFEDFPFSAPVFCSLLTNLWQEKRPVIDELFDSLKMSWKNFYERRDFLELQSACQRISHRVREHLEDVDDDFLEISMVSMRIAAWTDSRDIRLTEHLQSFGGLAGMYAPYVILDLLNWNLYSAIPTSCSEFPSLVALRVECISVIGDVFLEILLPFFSFWVSCSCILDDEVCVQRLLNVLTHLRILLRDVSTGATESPMLTMFENGLSSVVTHCMDEEIRRCLLSHSIAADTTGAISILRSCFMMSSLPFCDCEKVMETVKTSCVGRFPLRGEINAS